MARDSQDREDLLRDATAFKSRILLKAQLDEQAVKVFAGFHSTGAVSLYFDQDPVYHFNSSGQLRRAFVRERLIKAEQAKLVAWLPQRSQSQTSMLRQEMSSCEQTDFCKAIRLQLETLKQAVSTGSYTIEGQISPDGQEDVLQRFVSFLDSVGDIEIASSAHVGR